MTELILERKKGKRKKGETIMQDIKCLFHIHELFTRVNLFEPLEVGEKYCLPVSNRHRKNSSYLPSVTQTY